MGAGQEPVEPKRAAGASERPHVLLPVVALGAAAPILGLFVGPTLICAGERGGYDESSRALCGAIGILLYAPLSGLVAGCLAGALRPTWARFLAGLSGLVVGCVVAILALGLYVADHLLIALALFSPVFAFGYAVVGALRVLAERTRAGSAPDTSPGSATHDASHISTASASRRRTNRPT